MAWLSLSAKKKKHGQSKLTVTIALAAEQLVTSAGLLFEEASDYVASLSLEGDAADASHVMFSPHR